MNDNMEEKRMAGDYEIIQAVQIGDREVVLGECSCTVRKQATENKR